HHQGNARENPRDVEHETEGQDAAEALHDDEGREGGIGLNAANIAVGATDELSRLDPIVEAEGEPRQVLVDQRTKIGLDVVGRIKEVATRHDTRRARDQADYQDVLHVGVKRTRVFHQTRNGAAQDVGYQRLENQTDEGEDDGGQERQTVRGNDRQDSSPPGQSFVPQYSFARTLVAR